MDNSFAKVLSFAAFIVLGCILRRVGILKPEAFSAISGLVLNVTIPAVIITNLNGVRIEGVMLGVAALGLLSNVVLLAWALFLTRGIGDRDRRDFMRLNLGGYSVGPFALPYVQAFYPTTGLITTCMFDVGNVLMSGGGTYAVIAGTRVRMPFFKTIAAIIGKLLRSGPLVTFAFVGILSAFSLRLPDAVITCTSVAAQANTFLCMIMIGESINLSMNAVKFGIIVRMLAQRWIVCILIAIGFYFLLPFEEEVRRALTLTVLSPIPAMSLIFTAKLGGDISMAANLSSLSVGCSIIGMSAALTLFGVI